MQWSEATTEEKSYPTGSNLSLCINFYSNIFYKVYSGMQKFSFHI